MNTVLGWSLICAAHLSMVTLGIYELVTGVGVAATWIILIGWSGAWTLAAAMFVCKTIWRDAS